MTCSAPLRRRAPDRLSAEPVVGLLDPLSAANGAAALRPEPSRSWAARLHRRLLDVDGFAALLALWELAPRRLRPLPLFVLFFGIGEVAHVRRR